MLNNLRGFAVPEEFTGDIHTLLQPLFQEDLSRQTTPEAEDRYRFRGYFRSGP
jgi:hypothetical protein